MGDDNGEGGIDPRVREFRERYRAEHVHARYRGWLHFATTNVLVAVALWFCFGQLDSVHGGEWAMLPAAVLYANLAEYLGHRFVMHRPRRGLGLIYRRHAGQHHRFFTDTAMAVESSRDFKAVLFPPLLVVFFFGVFGTPVVWLVGLCLGNDAAWLFAIVSLLYFLNYEYLHLAYHMPEGHWVSRLPGLTALCRLHRTHHGQRLMSTCNFNITYPIGDWLFRTYARGKA